MNDEKKPDPKGEFRRGQKVSREAQGDLLAEAVTGLFSSQSELVLSDGSALDPEKAERPEPELEAEAPSASGKDGDPEVGKKTGPIPDSLWEQKMAWAKERVRDGRLEEAEELYRELVEEDPTNIRALNNLGVLLDEKGDPEGAVAHLRAARRIDPKNLEVLGNLGAALGALGKYGEAEHELRAAVKTDPANLEIRANLGILLFRRGLYDQAVDELRVVCASRADDGLPHFYMGEALNRLGRVDEAIEALTRVTELLPRNSKAYYTLGVLFDKKNLPDQASTMYRKAREFSDS